MTRARSRERRDRSIPSASNATPKIHAALLLDRSPAATHPQPPLSPEPLAAGALGFVASPGSPGDPPSPVPLNPPSPRGVAPPTSYAPMSIAAPATMRPSA